MPLELPALDLKQVSLPPVAEGVATVEDLTEQEQKKLEAVGWRMLNLPLIVCHSANGMPFFFPLQKVTACILATEAMLISLLVLKTCTCLLRTSGVLLHVLSRNNLLLPCRSKHLLQNTN